MTPLAAFSGFLSLFLGVCRLIRAPKTGTESNSYMRQSSGTWKKWQWRSLQVPRRQSTALMPGKIPAVQNQCLVWILLGLIGYFNHQCLYGEDLWSCSCNHMWQQYAILCNSKKKFWGYAPNQKRASVRQMLFAPDMWYIAAVVRAKPILQCQLLNNIEAFNASNMANF